MSLKNTKIIDGVVVLKEFDDNSLPNPETDSLYLYADDSSGTTIIKYKTSDGNETTLGAGGSGSSSAGITSLIGDISASGTGSVSSTISNDSVTYAKIQNVSAASRLLGRGSLSGSGDIQELTLGSGLSMSGTTLIFTGSVATVSGSSLPTYIRTNLTGGANVIGAPGGSPSNGDLRIYFLKQPTSGTSATLSFNSGFAFPSGYIPNVSTGNGQTDLFESMYDSGSTRWIATKFIGGFVI